MKIFKLFTIFMLIPGLCFGAASRDFDGSTDDLNLGDPLALQIVSDLTLVAWTNLDADPALNVSYQVIAKDKDTGGRAYTFDAAQESDVLDYYRFYINGGSAFPTTTNIARSATGQFNAGIWKYLTAVYDDTGASGTLQYYINGIASGAQVAGDGSIPTATANVLIGQREYVGFNDNFDGKITYCHIYNKVLTLVEINEVMWKPGVIADNLQFLCNPDCLIDLSANNISITDNGTTESSSGPPVMMGSGLPL